MVKNTNRVASAFAYVAALGLAFGASAAHWELSTDNDILYATEIFGANADDIELSLSIDDEDTTVDTSAADDTGQEDESTRVELELVLPPGTDVGEGSEAVVTFTLKDAVFGSTVGISDFDTRNADNLIIVNGSKEGGRAGTNSVSVEIIVPTTTSMNMDLVGVDPSPTTTDAVIRPSLILRLESLEGASALGTVDPLRTERTLSTRSRAAVTVSATVESTGRRDDRSEGADFPEEVCRPTVTIMGMEVNGCTKGSGAPAADNKIATSARALTFSAGNGGGSIDLNDRSSLAYGASSARLASFSMKSEDDSPKQEDGKTSFTVANGGKADLNITILGNIRDTDVVIFDGNRNGRVDDDEILDVEMGEASGSFRLDATRSGASVSYIPDGETDLERGDFETTFAVDFDDRLRNPGSVKGEATLGYAGIIPKASAYAIPGPDNEAMDVANVRIKCEAGTFSTCDVFLDCDAQDGVSYFGQAASELTGGATEHLTSAEIAEILGVDTWSGRLSCDVLSNNDASAQVLVRTGGALINNTYVSGKN